MDEQGPPYANPGDDAILDGEALRALLLLRDPTDPPATVMALVDRLGAPQRRSVVESIELLVDRGYLDEAPPIGDEDERATEALAAAVRLWLIAHPEDNDVRTIESRFVLAACRALDLAQIPTAEIVDGDDA